MVLNVPERAGECEGKQVVWAGGKERGKVPWRKLSSHWQWGQ